MNIQRVYTARFRPKRVAHTSISSPAGVFPIYFCIASLKWRYRTLERSIGNLEHTKHLYCGWQEVNSIWKRRLYMFTHCASILIFWCSPWVGVCVAGFCCITWRCQCVMCVPVKVWQECHHYSLPPLTL